MKYLSDRTLNASSGLSLKQITMSCCLDIQGWQKEDSGKRGTSKIS